MVFRDTTGTAQLSANYGNEGIVVERSTTGRVEDNIVNLVDCNLDSGTRGLIDSGHVERECPGSHSLRA
jgi:hypothetical protein